MSNPLWIGKIPTYRQTQSGLHQEKRWEAQTDSGEPLVQDVELWYPKNTEISKTKLSFKLFKQVKTAAQKYGILRPVPYGK